MARKPKNLNHELRDRNKPSGTNLADARFFERRSGIKDRRKINTYIFNDRRSGIADRRSNADIRPPMTLTEIDMRRLLS